MIRDRIAPVAWLMAASGILGGALYFSAPADATPENPNMMERIYLDVLADQGISNRDGPAAAIRSGYQVCSWLASGFTEFQAAQKIYAVTDLSIGYYDAGYIVGAAEGALCPGVTGSLVA